MKNLGLFTLLFTLSLELSAQERIFRCDDNVYSNTLSDPRAKNCRAMEDVSPDEKQWRPIGETKVIKAFLSRSPVVREGEYLKAWTLLSFKEPVSADGTKYRSAKSLDLYNCKTRTYATRQTVQYDDAVGGGSVVRTINVRAGELQVVDPIPGSLGESLLETVCAGSK